jgi:hypothetical protein
VTERDGGGNRIDGSGDCCYKQPRQQSDCGGKRRDGSGDS